MVRLAGGLVLIDSAAHVGTFAAGADFDPRVATDGDIAAFCDVFMEHLSRYSAIEADGLVPHTGVSSHVLCCCLASLEKLRCSSPRHELTVAKPDAAAIALIRCVEDIICSSENAAQGLRDHIVGKLATATALYALAVGARVISFSDRLGSLVKRGGFSFEEVHEMQLSKTNRGSLLGVARATGANSKLEYYSGQMPWRRVLGATVVLPCAMENEVDSSSAEVLADKGMKYLFEGSTMSCTEAAVSFLGKRNGRGSLPKVVYTPS